MNKLKIAIKCLEVAVNLIILISTGKDIIGALKKSPNKPITKKSKNNAV